MHANAEVGLRVVEDEKKTLKKKKIGYTLREKKIVCRWCGPLEPGILCEPF